MSNTCVLQSATPLLPLLPVCSTPVFEPPSGLCDPESLRPNSAERRIPRPDADREVLRRKRRRPSLSHALCERWFVVSEIVHVAGAEPTVAIRSGAWRARGNGEKEGKRKLDEPGRVAVRRPPEERCTQDPGEPDYQCTRHRRMRRSPGQKLILAPPSSCYVRR